MVVLRFLAGGGGLGGKVGRERLVRPGRREPGERRAANGCLGWGETREWKGSG